MNKNSYFEVTISFYYSDKFFIKKDNFGYVSIVVKQKKWDDAVKVALDYVNKTIQHLQGIEDYFCYECKFVKLKVKLTLKKLIKEEVNIFFIKYVDREIIPEEDSVELICPLVVPKSEHRQSFESALREILDSIEEDFCIGMYYKIKNKDETQYCRATIENVEYVKDATFKEIIDFYKKYKDTIDLLTDKFKIFYDLYVKKKRKKYIVLEKKI